MHRLTRQTTMPTEDLRAAIRGEFKVSLTSYVQVFFLTKERYQQIPDAAAATSSPSISSSSSSSVPSSSSSTSDVITTTLSNSNVPISSPAHAYDFFVAGVTDPGVPGKQNQDEFFTWVSPDKQSVVVGILDGHGRELGQLAAQVARDSLKASLASPEALMEVSLRPKEVLESAFEKAHFDIENAFRKTFEDSGWKVDRTKDGYLVKTQINAPTSARTAAQSKSGSSGPPLPASRATPRDYTPTPICIHGGTTATILIILHGRRIIVSNVGDSTGIICGFGNDIGKLLPVSMWTKCEPPVPLSSSDIHPPQAPLSRAPDSTANSYLEVSADHSPECPQEFDRMRKFRPHPSRRFHPELSFVYDTLVASKIGCPPIFDVDESTGVCKKTDAGTYYKNVRSEWAALVATPPQAGFQDALAFTRSLGDFHLHSYGVSYVPETFWLDITQPVETVQKAGNASITSGDASYTTSLSATAVYRDSPLSSPVVTIESPKSSEMMAMSPPYVTDEADAKLSSSSNSISTQKYSEAALVSFPVPICVSSDGIWDNWKFEDVASFLNTPSRIERAVQLKRADFACTELMAENLNRARTNFGPSADNMTAITIICVPRTF